METLNINDKIDELVKIKRQSLLDFEKAVEGLYFMGVRIFSEGEDGLPEVLSGQNLLPRYEMTLEDFEWKALYTDGTELDQFGEKDSHSKDIDQKKLKSVMYISNFDIDTTNEEKRLIITLNFQDGTFNFWNCGSLDVRGKLDKPNQESKKLILFKRKRESFTAGVSGQGITPTGEKMTYTRYYLGYETPNKEVLICIYPNGEIGIEEKK